MTQTIQYQNIMYKYIIGVLSFILCVSSCTKNTIEIGGITNKQQLDSIMALLPSDSVAVDSLPHRTLSVRMQGNLSLFGVPVRDVSFSLKKEDLEEMSVRYAPEGSLSLLNGVEAEYGLGKFSSGTFSWEVDTRQFELQPMDVKRWFSGNIPPINLNDTLGFNFTVTYAGDVDNKITNLYKELTPSPESYDYFVSTSFYSGINYNLYLNGFLIEDRYKRINNKLPQKGNQTLTIELLPPFDKIKEIDDYIKRLSGGGEQEISVYRMDENGANKVVLAKMFLDTDIARKGTKQTFTFNIPDLPYTLEYINGVDMQGITDIKTQIYAHYQKLKDAIETKNESEFIELMYPIEKIEALAFNKKKVDLQYRWELLESTLDDNEGVDLMDINDLEVEFTNEGRLARLVPKNNKDKGASGMIIYIRDDSPFDGAYYVYMDNTNTINFALR